MADWNRLIRKLSMAAVRILIMLIVRLIISLRLFEKTIVFQPQRTWSGFPRIPYENVHFAATDGIQLHGWFLSPPDSSRVFSMPWERRKHRRQVRNRRVRHSDVSDKCFDVRLSRL